MAVGIALSPGTTGLNAISAASVSQARRVADQAETRARELRAQADDAQTQAQRSRDKADTIAREVAGVTASPSRTSLAVPATLQSAPVGKPASASNPAPRVNTQGQAIGRLLNVTA